MVFERRKWEYPGFYATGSPAWPCPTCHTETMRVVQESLAIDQTPRSRLLVHAADPEDGPPEDHYLARFSCLLRCTGCKEPMVAAGNVGLEPGGQDEDGNTMLERYLAPLLVNPAPALFEIPAKATAGVKVHLERSFALFWLDAPAAAGCVRAAVEVLLDDQGVPRRFKTKRGEIRWLPLHGRIKKFEIKEPILGRDLLAIKFLGNTGAHTTDLKRSDLLDAFEILSHILDELIINRRRRIALLAAEIIRKKGPRSVHKPTRK